MEGAGGFAVEVLRVLGDDAAKLGEIEVRIHRLHRVERPLDQVVALRQGAIALCQLQPVAKAAAILRKHARHVRPHHRLAVFHADDGIGESNHVFTRLEGPQKDGAAVHREDEHRDADHVGCVRVSPDLLFELDDLPVLVDGGQIANLYVSHESMCGSSSARVVMTGNPAGN